MDYAVFIVFMGLNLVVVSGLIYGRARAQGVAAAIARRILIELWIGAAVVLGLLAWAGRMTGGNVLAANGRGQAIGVGAAVICLAVLLYILKRVNQVISVSADGGPSEPGSPAAATDVAADPQDPEGDEGTIVGEAGRAQGSDTLE